MTARERIRLALVELGVYPASQQTLKAHDAAEGLIRLQWMVEALQLNPLLVHQVVRSTFSLVANQQDYTIGLSGADWTLARPDTISQVAVLTGTSPDTSEVPIGPLLTAAQWAAIPNKEQTGEYPQAARYERTYPLGTLSLWPVPNLATVDVAIYVPTPITAPLTLATDMVVAPGYDEWLHYSLVERLAGPFAQTIGPDLERLIRAATARLESPNVEVGRLQADDALTGGGFYNVLTGQSQ